MGGQTAVNPRTDSINLSDVDKQLIVRHPLPSLSPLPITEGGSQEFSPNRMTIFDKSSVALAGREQCYCKLCRLMDNQSPNTPAVFPAIAFPTGEYFFPPPPALLIVYREPLIIASSVANTFRLEFSERRFPPYTIVD